MTHQAQQKQVVTCQICKLQGHTADQHLASDGTIHEPRVYTDCKPKPRATSYVAAVTAHMKEETTTSTSTKVAEQSSSSSE